MAWSKEAEARLLRLYAEGLEDYRIAARLNEEFAMTLTASAVRGKLARIRPQRPAVSLAAIARDGAADDRFILWVMQCGDEGMDWAECARLANAEAALPSQHVTPRLCAEVYNRVLSACD